ncbi:MAG: hypothetical protein IT506_07975 [Aquabacterium sp.]|nr:hypothetical protein [Aquabacterium sp.]
MSETKDGTMPGSVHPGHRGVGSGVVLQDKNVKRLQEPGWMALGGA